MEQDKIVKGYDPVIMRRLFSFARPYRGVISIAMIAMLIATVAELLGPVILQKAVDQDIVVRYHRLNVTTSPAAILDELKEGFDPFGRELPPDFGDYRFVPAGAIEQLGADERQALTDQGEWYLTALEHSDRDLRSELRKALGATPLLEEGQWIAFPSTHLKEFDRKLLEQLRAADLDRLESKALIYLFLLIGMLLFSFLQVYLMSYSGQGVMKGLRDKLFSHTLSQHLSYLGGIPVGTLVTRISNDVETINELFTSVATGLLKDFATMIGVIFILFYLDPILALITCASLPPVAILTFFFRTRARDAYRRVRMWTSRVNAFLSEHISGMDVVQAFRREDASRKQFEERNGNLLEANLSEMYVFATFRPLINLLTSVSIGTVLYFGSILVLDSAVSLGVLIAFVNLMQMFYRPVMNFTENFTILQSAMAGGERIFNLLDQKHFIEDKGTEPLPDPLEGSIEFSNVHFSYKKGEPVIKDLSFSIQAGETVAIVGYTGAGKTTIANLLTRLWDIDSGSIRLDGRDIRSYPLEELRAAVVPVQQDLFLFADSIAENIAMGKDLSREELESAAVTVQADGLIESLPGGFEHVLNERAAQLSTGQRQLISFSRVVAQDPRVIILDEATGSIDTETEKLIQKAMNQLMQGRTSIVIAHRLSTIQHADRILVLSNGKLVESGKHDELLKQEGLYAKLYRFQYKE